MKIIKVLNKMVSSAHFKYYFFIGEMKTYLIIGILSVLVTTTAFAGNPTDVKVYSYDGMVHLELSGLTAKDYYDAIQTQAIDNGAVLMKSLNDGELNCSQIKASGAYQCTISLEDGSNGEDH